MQAKKTVGQYVEYISKYVEDVLQQMNNEAAMQQQLQQAQQQGGHPWPLPQHYGLYFMPDSLCRSNE